MCAFLKLKRKPVSNTNFIQILSLLYLRQMALEREKKGKPPTLILFLSSKKNCLKHCLKKRIFLTRKKQQNNCPSFCLLLFYFDCLSLLLSSFSFPRQCQRKRKEKHHCVNNVTTIDPYDIRN